MLAAERRRKIIDILNSNESATVVDLARHFGVSESTIRRDLSLLEEQAGIERTHGGAVAPTRYEPSFMQKTTTRQAQKRAIARRAAQLVQPGQTILLDAGTTTLELARTLRGIPDLTVATNSVPIAYELGSEFNLILTGGSVKERTLALIGPLAEQALERMYVDIAFLGMNGVAVREGFTTPSHEEAETKSRMLRAARLSVVLADSTKLGRVTFVGVAPIDGADILITDDEAEPSLVEELRAAGLQVEVAAPEGDA